MLKFKYKNSLPLNSRFIIALIVFVCINLGGLHYESIFKNNSTSHVEAVGLLEELKTSIYKQRHLISYLQIQYTLKGNNVDESFLELVKENNSTMHQLVKEVQSLNTSGEFGISSIREIYFDSSWRVDEGFKHFQLLIDSYVDIVKDLSRSKIKERDRIYLSIEKHGENLLNSLIPIQQELMKTRSQYFRFITINDYIFRISIFLMALVVYAYLYRPWKAQIEHFTQESERLKGVLSESERKGDIYSWELNYYTKEIKHSKQLATIFNLAEDSEFAYLYDELSSFDSDGRENFLEAIENCIHKNEDLETTVRITAKNQRTYWLEYSARRMEKGNETWIVGTVQNVTTQKVAQNRFDSLFHEIDLPLIVFGEGQVRDLNSAAKKFFGVTDDEGYKLLHPAVMFPLYQEDGRSSLEKLSQSIAQMDEGKTIIENWSFHTVDYGTLTAKTTMLNIAYKDSNLHIMIISEKREAYDLERRLINAHRRAQYSKRAKTEYIAKNGIILEGMIDSVEKVLARLNKEKEYSEAERVIDISIVESIKAKLSKNWADSFSQPIEEGYGLIIFDFNEMMVALESRWQRMNKRRKKILINRHFENNYFWGDILKIKALLIGVVDNAMMKSEHSDIEVNIYHDMTNNSKELIKVDVSCLDPSWPGSEWVDLSEDNAPTFMDEVISPKKLYSLIEYLDGDLELHKSSKNLIHDGKISFAFSVKSVHGKLFKGDKEVYFMMNRKEYFVPYKESALSSTEIWTHFGGDWDLIESAIEDLIDYYPQAISDIQFGLIQKDGEVIYNAASELYGVLTHFPFFSSIDRVVLIQKYGEYLKFQEVEKELSILIKELLAFSNVLEEFLPKTKTKDSVA